jgi:serine/threonine-protein kinase
MPRKVGKYLLQSKLGQGGMGTVYLAIQEGLQREVAVKLLTEKALDRRPDLLRRFVKEVSVCARLSHPNIVKIFDYGQEGHDYYYAMEVVRARSLEEVLKADTTLPLNTALELGRCLADALAYMHEQGIVHRDIKPANILLDEQGSPILTDFGLVKDLEGTDITQVGAAVGTPYYMAPEMFRGKGVGPASDLYQLGIVLYRALTGQLPFRGANAADLAIKILHTEPEPPRSLAPALPVPVENILLNCLEKDPEVRYRNASELREDLALAGRRAQVPRRRDSATALAPAPSGVARDPSPPEAQPAPGSGARPRRTSAASPSRPVPPHRPTTQQPLPVTVPIATWRRSATGAAVVVAAVAILLAAWLSTRPSLLTATDVQLRVGARRATLQWASPTEYQGRVEWGERGSPTRAVASETAPSLRHSATLEPLQPGKLYTIHVVFPDGSRSLEYTLRAQNLQPIPRALTATDTSLELVFDTAAPALATLRVGPTTTQDSAPVAHHRLTALGCRPLEQPAELALVDAVGDRTVVAGSALIALFRQALLLELMNELVRLVGAYDPDRFLLDEIDRLVPESACTGASDLLIKTGIDGLLLGNFQGKKPTYVGFPDGDPQAKELAAKLRAHLAPQPFVPVLSTLTLLARGFLDERRVPVDSTRRFVDAVRKLQDVDYFAKALNLPCSTGVDRLLGRDFRLEAPSSLPAATIQVDSTVAEPQKFAFPWRHYQSFSKAELVPPESVGRLWFHDWKPALPDPARWKRATLCLLDVRLDTELMFRVTVNGKLTLDFRHTTPASSGFKANLPLLAMSFDPRFLEDGPNRLHVELAQTPGTRFLGLKLESHLASLRLFGER